MSEQGAVGGGTEQSSKDEGAEQSGKDVGPEQSGKDVGPEQSGKDAGPEQIGRKRRPTEREDHGVKKPSRDIFLNPLYNSEIVKAKLAEAFKSDPKKDFMLDNGAVVKLEPFRHCILPDFLRSLRYVSSLQDSMCSLLYKIKYTDLFSFGQTDDLKVAVNQDIKAFVEFLQEIFQPWVSAITGIQLDDTVDISASCYDQNDYLLCHNDQLERRKIAFIFYFTRGWIAEDGGTLDLFNSCDGIPSNIHSSIIPEYNMMTFFEVSAASFHQVAEVLSNKSRYSLSGWFHGEPAEVLESIPRPMMTMAISPLNAEISVGDFINSDYLGDDLLRDIQNEFQESSEMQLQEFLKPEVYDEVCAELRSVVNWKHEGPPHKRSFKALKTEDLPPATLRLKQVLESEEFLSLLSGFVGLKLKLRSCEIAPPQTSSSSMASAASEPSSSDSASSGKFCALSSTVISKFGHRDYTLLHDHDNILEVALDAIIFFNCDGWNSEVHGGAVTYAAKDEEDPIIDIDPTPNSLSLVYREKGVVNFTRYVNNKVNDDRHDDNYHCLSMVFTEVP